MVSLAWFLVLSLAGISFSSFAYNKFKNFEKTYHVPRPVFFILVGLSIVALGIGAFMLYDGLKGDEVNKEISYFFIAFLTVGSGFYHLLSALRNYLKWRASEDDYQDPYRSVFTEHHEMNFDFLTKSDSDSNNNSSDSSSND